MMTMAGLFPLKNPRQKFVSPTHVPRSPFLIGDGKVKYSCDDGESTSDETEGITKPHCYESAANVDRGEQRSFRVKKLFH